MTAIDATKPQVQKKNKVAEVGSIDELKNIHSLELKITLLYLSTLVVSLLQMWKNINPLSEGTATISAAGFATAYALTVRKIREVNKRELNSQSETPATTEQPPVAEDSHTPSPAELLHR